MDGNLGLGQMFKNLNILMKEFGLCALRRHLKFLITGQVCVVEISF